MASGFTSLYRMSKYFKINPGRLDEIEIGRNMEGLNIIDDRESLLYPHFVFYLFASQSSDCHAHRGFHKL